MNSTCVFFHWKLLNRKFNNKTKNNFKLINFTHRICHIFIRYAFTPFLQMETPTFEKLGRAFIEGMKWYVPFSTYESRLFLARRLAGIPGYQFDVDPSKEYYQKQIFTKDELEKFKTHFQNEPGFEYRRNMVFDEKMHLIDIKRLNQAQKDEEHFDEYLDYNSNTYGIYRDNLNNNNNNNNEEQHNFLLEFFNLDHSSELVITEVDDENYQQFMNDRQFKLLSKRDQFFVKLANHTVNMVNNNLTRPLYEIGLGGLLYAMKKQIF